MKSSKRISEEQIGISNFLKNLTEQLVVLLNKNIPLGKFFLLDSRFSWNIIGSKALNGSFNIMFLDELIMGKNPREYRDSFRQYKIIIISSFNRNKEEFQFVVNKNEPYSTKDLNKVKNEIFTKILKIAKKFEYN
jgi:hypothetical protein